MFSGRVQGVGFRYQTHEIARRHPVTGHVQNQPDGTVLLVIEGDPSALENMIKDVCNTMAGHIHSHSVTERPATSEYREFTIRR